jgi:hypothetical protein
MPYTYGVCKQASPDPQPVVFQCPDADAVGPEQLSSLSKQLTAAHERLQELLVLAQQQANNEGEEEQ